MKSLSYSKRQRVLTFVILELLAVLPCVGQNSNSNPTVELFKQFIESPPPIEKMLIRYKDLRYTNATSQYYLIRYQTNGLELRQVNSFEDLALPKMGYPQFFLHFENKWLYMDTHRKLRYWLDDGKMPKNLNNEFYEMFNTGEEFVGNALNFGVVDVVPGTIRWNGNNFDAGENTDKQIIYGKLAASDDQPLRLDWVIKYQNKIHMWQSTYTFDDQLPKYIPRLILTSVLEGTNYIPRFEVEIFHVDFAPSLMSANQFPVDDYLTNSENILYYTNGELMFKLPDQRGLFSANPLEEKFKSHTRNVLWMIIGFNAVLISILAIFAFKNKAKKRNNK